MGENSKSLVVERLTTPLLWKDWRELKNPCYGEIEEIEDEVEKKFKLFSNFNVLADSPEDHRFINNKRTFYHADTAAYYKTIHKEWAILEAGLPSSIYVRAYTTRIDLMRAVIIGPEGTPYCHGLFFFDISIPSKYPAQPPEIFYLSYGLEVNPNLHRKGKVSLDILSSGFRHKLCLHKKQKWNPDKSNILEVLVSIQRSILKGNSYPPSSLCQYIFEGEGSSKYDKDIFMASCESMLCALHHPPTNFEDFVAGHFRKRAHPILMICQANMDTSISKDPMNQLFQHLIRAFEANGTYCQHHYTPKKNSRKIKELEANAVYDQRERTLDGTTWGLKWPWPPQSVKELFYLDLGGSPDV